MKLALFSDQNKPEVETVKHKLIDLIGKNKPIIGYISSCPDPLRIFYDQKKQYYTRLGASLTPYFDLETEFNSDGIEMILQADAIHLSGGNTFRFYHWIIRRGLSNTLKQYARSGKVIIGISAGAIIMTPNIGYSQICGDKNDIGLTELKGLGLVDFNFVPHVNLEKSIDKTIIEQSQKDKSKVVIASDNDWLIIKNTTYEIYGKPLLITNGKLTAIKNL